MIILVGGQKGGTGKSTLATNIAVCLAHEGSDTLLIDSDPQASATHWWERRQQSDEGLPLVNVAQRSGGNIYDSLMDMASRYEQTVIDAGGQDSREFRSALLACDILITPLRPSQADLETLVHVEEVLESIRALRQGEPAAYAVLNLAPTHYQVRETEQAEEYLSASAIGLCRSVIRDRKIFRDTSIMGRGVIEMPKNAGADEINALVEELYRGK